MSVAAHIEGHPHRTSRRPSIRHAENPERPGYALCGAKLGSTPMSASGDRCVVCYDLSRPAWVLR